MLVTIDKEFDSMYINLHNSKQTIYCSNQITKGIIFDYSPTGDILGIEILEYSNKDTSKRLLESLLSLAKK